MLANHSQGRCLTTQVRKTQGTNGCRWPSPHHLFLKITRVLNNPHFYFLSISISSTCERHAARHQLDHCQTSIPITRKHIMIIIRLDMSSRAGKLSFSTSLFQSPRPACPHDTDPSTPAHPAKTVSHTTQMYRLEDGRDLNHEG